MIVKQGNDVARKWVAEEAAKSSGFRGAFFHGSVNWLDEDAALPATSDVDLMVAVDDPSRLEKPGKFIYRGVLLDVAYLPNDQFRLPEVILSDY